MCWFEKNDGSTADDVVDCCEKQLTPFNLSYGEAVATTNNNSFSMFLGLMFSFCTISAPGPAGRLEQDPGPTVLHNGNF